MAIGAGIFVSLAGHLLRGDDKGAGSLLERVGKNAILNLLGGSSSPFAMLVGSVLEGKGLLSRDDVRKTITRQSRRQRAQAHQEWLNNNRWRFDWRSQPRRPAGTEAGGEWMEGRLDYPIAQKPIASRSQRRRRIRAMRAYKARQNAAGNMKTRTIRSSWGDY